LDSFIICSRCVLLFLCSLYRMTEYSCNLISFLCVIFFLRRCWDRIRFYGLYRPTSASRRYGMRAGICTTAAARVGLSLRADADPCEPSLN
jgi:hypothetical protein